MAKIHYLSISVESQLSHLGTVSVKLCTILGIGFTDGTNVLIRCLCNRSPSDTICQIVLNFPPGFGREDSSVFFTVISNAP